VADLKVTVEAAGNHGFDFVQVPLFHPLFKRDHTSITRRAGPPTRNDTVMTANDWAVLVVAKLSPWIRLESGDPVIRSISEDGFFQELSLATHLGVPAVLIPLQSSHCVNLARCLHRPLLTSTQIYWVHVPLVSPKLTATDLDQEDQELSNECDDPWQWWNTLRTLCDNNAKLHLVLEFNSVLPSSAHQTRWLGEPVKAVSIPTDIFILNRKGYPVLPKKHQEYLFKLFKLNTQVVLTGYSKADFDIKTYLQYLNYLFKNQLSPTSLESYAKGFEEYLQSPLQPLRDNLDSATYEVFEKDPVKYVSYEKAIACALVDRVPDDSVEDTTCVVMVVGAGRGPLVEASLKASRSTKRKIRVYAVEKNPGAVNTLQNRQRDEWGDNVTIISCDMRLWTAPEKADILVSELLGSFGDNELSPECLDGAQTFLRSDGISIPSSYTSHLCPVSSAKLHALVSTAIDKEKETRCVCEGSTVFPAGLPSPPV
jgi:protein arginine N-methyltransferase 5